MVYTIYLRDNNVVIERNGTTYRWISTIDFSIHPEEDLIVIRGRTGDRDLVATYEDIADENGVLLGGQTEVLDYLSPFVNFKLGGGTGNGGTHYTEGEVSIFADLPQPPGDYIGKRYEVLQGSQGFTVLGTRFAGKDPGVYRSDGVVWRLVKRELDSTEIPVDPTNLDFTNSAILQQALQDLQQNYVSLITNNSGQIKLNWSVANEPRSLPGFTSGVPVQIPLNSLFTVSGFPTTTYPHLANQAIGGDNVISPATLNLREIKAGQTIIFRVKAGYFNKGGGQNGNFTIRMYNPNPASSFDIIKSVPTPDGTTEYDEEFEFIAIADNLSLDPLYGYRFEAQSTFNDGNLTAYIENITAFYLPVESFNK